MASKYYINEFFQIIQLFALQIIIAKLEAYRLAYSSIEVSSKQGIRNFPDTLQGPILGLLNNNIFVSDIFFFVSKSEMNIK